MFSFFHPKPAVDGRAVAVMVVQQKAAALQGTRTLIVPNRRTAPTEFTPTDEGVEK